MIAPKRKFMGLAIKEAQLAQQEGDYAVGAVLVKGNKVIARCSNRSKRDESPIAHAEMLAIMKGSKIFEKSPPERMCYLYNPRTLSHVCKCDCLGEIKRISVWCETTRYEKIMQKSIQMIIIYGEQ